MNKPHTRVFVDTLPDCDICQYVGRKQVRKAHYDGRNTIARTAWANMCREHFREYGLGLGLGIGQELIQRPSRPEGEE